MNFTRTNACMSIIINIGILNYWSLLVLNLPCQADNTIPFSLLEVSDISHMSALSTLLGVIHYSLQWKWETMKKSCIRPHRHWACYIWVHKMHMDPNKTNVHSNPGPIVTEWGSLSSGWKKQCAWEKIKSKEPTLRNERWEQDLKRTSGHPCAKSESKAKGHRN